MVTPQQRQHQGQHAGRHQRLQLANRIHLQLLRELGRGVDVSRLLKDEPYAREVLLVCDALPTCGLAQLAAQFRATVEREPVLRRQVWTQDVDIDLSTLGLPHRAWAGAQAAMPAR